MTILVSPYSPRIVHRPLENQYYSDFRDPQRDPPQRLGPRLRDFLRTASDLEPALACTIIGSSVRQARGNCAHRFRLKIALN